jgi:hypothetical protein
MARSIKMAPEAPVYVTNRPGRREAGEVVSDSGIGPIDVRIIATGEIEHVEIRDLQVRRTPARPPPGAGGRDVPPLHFGDRSTPGPDYVEAWRTHGWRSGPERRHTPIMAAPLAPAPAPLVAQPKPVTYRDPDHLAYVRELPCAVPWCGKPGPSEACHARGPRGIAQKVDDLRSFPGCAEHHRELHDKATLGRLDEAHTRDLEREMVIATQAQRLRWYRAVVAELLGRGAPAGSG